jgi:hypothetical protein
MLFAALAMLFLSPSGLFAACPGFIDTGSRDEPMDLGAAYRRETMTTYP